MEFFDRMDKLGKGGKKAGSEKAGEVLSQLATAIADAPETSDLEVGTYTALYTMRVEKAKRAYAKAVKAMAEDDQRGCLEIAVRGLLHLQIANMHAHTEVSQLTAAESAPRGAMPGGCETVIQQLADAICRIKLLAEYKNMELSKELRGRLASVVQSLQDAIEAYGNADYKQSLDTAISGIIWCQYIYARLGGNELFSAKQQQTKTLRTLFTLARDLGAVAFDPVSRQTRDGRSKISALEDFLQAAMNGYFEEALDKMEKFARLGGIEATSLARHVARVKTKDLVSAVQQSGAPDHGPNQTVKQMIGEMRELIDRHHPHPDRALVALEALQHKFSLLRRWVRAEDWREAKLAIDGCRFEIDCLSREADRLND